jgi:hypothetical protein
MCRSLPSPPYVFMVCFLVRRTVLLLPFTQRSGVGPLDMATPFIFVIQNFVCELRELDDRQFISDSCRVVNLRHPTEPSIQWQPRPDLTPKPGMHRASPPPPWLLYVEVLRHSCAGCTDYLYVKRLLIVVWIRCLVRYGYPDAFIRLCLHPS